MSKYDEWIRRINEVISDTGDRIQNAAETLSFSQEYTLDYPEQWNNHQRDLWAETVGTTYADMADNESRAEFHEAQYHFQMGFLEMNDDRSFADFQAHREEFYELTGVTADTFNWAAWREYLAEEFDSHGEAA